MLRFDRYVVFFLLSLLDWPIILIAGLGTRFLGRDHCLLRVGSYGAGNRSRVCAPYGGISTDLAMWVRPAEPVKPISSSLGPMAHPLELAACPSNDISIDPFEGRTQLRWVKVTVVVEPAADARVVYRGQLSQGQVTAMV